MTQNGINCMLLAKLLKTMDTIMVGSGTRDKSRNTIGTYSPEQRDKKNMFFRFSRQVGSVISQLQ